MPANPNDDIAMLYYYRVNDMIRVMMQEASRRGTSEERRRSIAAALNAMVMGTGNLIGFMSDGNPKQASDLAEVAVQQIYEQASVGQREMADIKVKMGGKG